MTTASVPVVTAVKWEPLPPREVKSRQQRRRVRTRTVAVSSSSSKADGGPGPNKGEAKSDTSNENTTKNAPAVQRKPTRPGFNSYLKVILDNATMDRLAGVAKSIQTKVQNLQQSDISIDTAIDTIDPAINKNDGTSQTIKEELDLPKKPKKRREALRFKPRSRASLHMTFFFGGEALCELPADELVDWHGKVRDRLKDSNFFLASPETGEEHGTLIDDCWFDVTDVSMFPPKRNNLIVAILEASPAFHDLHNDVRTVAKNSNSQGLNAIAAYSKDKWTAHVTLGNILGGGTKVQIRKCFDEVLREVLDELVQDPTTSSTSSELEEDEASPAEVANLPKEDKPRAASKSKCLFFRARTHGIAMGGPVPEQVQLDWDFTYKPFL